MVRDCAIAFVVIAALACTPARSVDEGPSETGTSSTDAPGSSDGTQTSGETETEAESEAGGTDETGETDETGDDGEGGLSECPQVGPAQVQGVVSAPELSEASGMVRSRTQELLWVHNDSGDSARLFALGLDAGLLAIVELEGASAIDWEDLALGPGPASGDWLYVGDIGDNAEARPSVTVYRLPEPSLVDHVGSDPLTVDGWEALELSYPDGPHDAETLLVDPVSGDLFIVSKGTQTRLFRRPAPLSSGELEQLADPTFPSAVATAGDISPLGDFVLVRGYVDGFAWLRAPGQTIGEAMLGEPCPIPLAAEQQGETIAIEADGWGYFTLSEGTKQPLRRFAFSN